MPHNNMQLEHSFRADSWSRGTRATPVGLASVSPFRNPTIPITTPPQAPPTINRGPVSELGHSIFTVCLPAQQQHANPFSTGIQTIHMVPTSTHYDEQLVHNTTNSPSSDEETAVTAKQGNHSATGSFDSQQEVAHSVLLLASSLREQEKRKASASPSTTTDSDPRNTKVPFKKRKMVSEIMRVKESSSSVHISPVSHGSKTGVSALSPDRSQTSNESSVEDLKGRDALPDSAKTTDAGSIAPPETVTVAHFPSQLYDALTTEESALQWCSNGKAWRIVRWDSLRKNVLPKYFGGLSVDSFLSEISSWGFTEVMNGADAGAYSHTLFRRGFPNLCKEIQNLCKPIRTSTPSILQVPSLGDVAATTSYDENSKSCSPPQNEVTSSPNQHNNNKTIVETASTTPSWSFHYSQRQQTQTYIPYRREDNFLNIVEYHVVQQPPQQQQHPQATTWVQAIPPEQPTTYSPARVRSGRGAARLPVQVTPNPSRRAEEGGRSNNFRVVSNRGRRRNGLTNPLQPRKDSPPMVVEPNTTMPNATK